MKRKDLLALLLSAICGVLVTILFRIDLLESLELKSLDFRFRQFARSEKASPDVVIVAIDDKSLLQFKRNNIVWKWPRDIYALLVRYLQRGGAKVIVFDILFPDSDIDRLSTDAEETDGEFAQAMREADNVIIAAHLRQDEDLLSGDNPLEHRDHITIVPKEAINDFMNYSSAVLPISLFQQSAKALGAANYFDDPQDGICRRVPLFYVYQDVVFPHLGMAAYLMAKGIDQVDLISNDRFRFGDNEVPVDDNDRFLITWYGQGGPGPNGCFRYYSIVDLIASALDEENDRDPALPSSIFKDKIIIIGSNASAMFDFRNTPFTTYEPYPAMEIYATMLSNLLQSDYLIRAHPLYAILAIFFFAFVICYMFLYVPNVRLVILLVFVGAGAWFLVTLALFNWNHVWLDMIAPEVSILISFSAAAVVSYQTEGKARRRLRSMFNRYLSPVVITEFLEKDGTVELGGKEITGTVYFSDIKDFTAISEQTTPPDLVTLLNEYFAIATDIILRNDGLLDKYIGDAIMAIFGAPIPNNTHAHQACAAAIEIQRLLKQNMQSQNNNQPKLLTRIGINTGSMVVGNIGSHLRLDYTAIGDTVNLASRLEGVNKIFTTNILISDSTFELVKDVFVARELDLLRVKGKKESVVIYQLVGKHGDVNEENVKIMTTFGDGIRWYRECAFDKAISVFESVLSTFPNDGPSRAYIGRCQKFKISPPPPDWDGVYKLDTK